VGEGESFQNHDLFLLFLQLNEAVSIGLLCGGSENTLNDRRSGHDRRSLLDGGGL
jgi:hypothetical protein